MKCRQDVIFPRILRNKVSNLTTGCWTNLVASFMLDQPMVCRNGSINSWLHSKAKALCLFPSTYDSNHLENHLFQTHSRPSSARTSPPLCPDAAHPSSRTDNTSLCAGWLHPSGGGSPAGPWPGGLPAAGERYQGQGATACSAHRRPQGRHQGRGPAPAERPQRWRGVQGKGRTPTRSSSGLTLSLR